MPLLIFLNLTNIKEPEGPMDWLRRNLDKKARNKLSSIRTCPDWILYAYVNHRKELTDTPRSLNFAFANLTGPVNDESVLEELCNDGIQFKETQQKVRVRDEWGNEVTMSFSCATLWRCESKDWQTPGPDKAFGEEPVLYLQEAVNLLPTEIGKQVITKLQCVAARQNELLEKPVASSKCCTRNHKRLWYFLDHYFKTLAPSKGVPRRAGACNGHPGDHMGLTEVPQA